MSVKISGVVSGSPANKKNVAPGDILVSINGRKIRDVLDYRFFADEPKLKMIFQKPNGSYYVCLIKKEAETDVGLSFDTYLMDGHQSCRNKCIFCFIDQLPKGMRESLYFKDDDSRLSFLFGNYITLTNLTDEDVQRIIDMHLSPVNISVHTMNPDLRVKMMANRFAGESLKYLYKLAEAGIKINTQIVCCPGINDGKELEYSVTELYKLYPAVQSIAVVPVGLTAHREGLFELKPFTAESAGAVIDLIDELNNRFCSDRGEKIAFAADEFYICSGRQMPGAEYYNGYPQLENGVGMCALLKEEFLGELDNVEITDIDRKVTVVTGKAAYPLLGELAQAAMEKIKGLYVQVIAAENKLFGPLITVSGLLCGADIISALEGKELYEQVLIPQNCLRRDDDVLLDDMTVDDLSKELGVSVSASGTDGACLLHSMLGK